MKMNEGDKIKLGLLIREVISRRKERKKSDLILILPSYTWYPNSDVDEDYSNIRDTLLRSGYHPGSNLNDPHKNTSLRILENILVNELHLEVKVYPENSSRYPYLFMNL